MNTKRSKEFALCCVADANYLPQFSACIISFLEFHSTENWSFFLFSNDIQDNDLSALREKVSSISKGTKLELVKIDATKFESFFGFWQNHGRQVFYRFVIPNSIPDSFEFILYLDVDMIINGEFDFDELKPKNNRPVAAVRDHISDILASKRDLQSYFNSGFLIINREYWMNNNITNKLFKVNPPIRRFADQDILNEMFKDNWHELKKAYNYPASKLNYSLRGFKSIGEAKPIVIHFNGGIKPWNYWQKGSRLYWKFILKSPFKSKFINAPLSIYKSLEYKLLKFFTTKA